jgi:hypothetical protein
MSGTLHLLARPEAYKASSSSVLPMASRSDSRSNPIADEVVRYGELAYNPDVPAEHRSADISRFNDLLTR